VKKVVWGMRIETALGEIFVSPEVFTSLSGNTATNCFGVKGMAARSVSDGLVHRLRPDSLAKGVKVTYNDDRSVNIELHIIVEHGVSIPAIGPSIISEVRFTLEKYTSCTVRQVDVCVDSIQAEAQQ
jgi:uncharacterized alkaline shock family protein YloU